MNLDVTENELKGLDTSILDSTIVLEIPLHEQEAAEQPRKTSRKRKRGKKKIEVQVNEDGEEFVPEKKLRKKRAPKPEPVYIIPDVERKETTFKGRLGYACLNTVLRNKRPASESVFCSRTCRLDSLSKNGMEWVKDLGRQNVRDLITMIQWNEDNQIRFLRLSSEMFPFASHGQHGYSLDYCAEWLKEAGDLANKYGHRLTTHPGQFTQLGSPKAKVIDAAVRELEYHCQMLDIMGVGADGVMIVHGGGTYGDKASAVERIKNTISEVLSPKVRARLVLENDEMCYNAEDLLAICEELDVPLVFDYHHDMLNPSSIPPSEIIKRADAIWKRRGIRPKQHLSEPRPGAVTLMERRAHADRCDTLPPDLPDDMDLMIEVAKDKEQAVFHLYRIYGLAPVIHANLRPPNPNPTKETNGRKSNKRTTRVRVAKLEENGALGSNDELLGPRDDDDRFLRIVPSTEDVMDDGPLTPIESPNIPNSMEGQRLPGRPCVESCGEEKEVGEQQQQKRRKYKADLDEEPQEQDDIAAISSKKRVRRRSTSKNEDSDTNRSRSPQLVRDSITSSGT
ncbi:UV-damage endonuclease [Leucoagaricus sp. SymC.cos]|nr:UV-damage endonuclease [Leucoagaricus sp. SymC.cos]